MMIQKREVYSYQRKFNILGLLVLVLACYVGYLEQNINKMDGKCAMLEQMMNKLASMDQTNGTHDAATTEKMKTMHLSPVELLRIPFLSEAKQPTTKMDVAVMILDVLEKADLLNKTSVAELE